MQFATNDILSIKTARYVRDKGYVMLTFPAQTVTSDISVHEMQDPYVTIQDSF